MEITRNNENLLKICRGGVTQWEKPRAEIELSGVFSGSGTISGIASPKRSTVKVQVLRDKGIIYENSIEKGFFEFSIGVPKFEDGDRVIITVSSPGYLTGVSRQIIR